MNYPEHDARIGMLTLLHDLLEEALTEGNANEGKLWLAYYPSGGGRPTRLEVYEPKFDIAEALGINGDEAYGRLKDLAEDGYLRLSSGSVMFGVSFTEKGRTAISKLPDPHELLLATIDEIVEAIDGLQDVDPVEKDDAKEGAQRVSALLEQLPDKNANVTRNRIANIVGLGTSEPE